MTIQFWTVGKSHEPYVASGVLDFTKRITNYFPASWKIIPPPKNDSGDAILKLLTPGSYLVALDEGGKQFTSPQLASFLQQRANESVKQLIFLIGGAYGIDKPVLQRANFTWSLSALTFPHQLVRLILAEQVYRACTIIRNEKYHHA